MRETADKNNLSLVLCVELLLAVKQSWIDTNRMTIMNPTARQDIIGKLATVILFLKARYIH